MGYRASRLALSWFYFIVLFSAPDKGSHYSLSHFSAALTKMMVALDKSHTETCVSDSGTTWKTTSVPSIGEGSTQMGQVPQEDWGRGEAKHSKQKEEAASSIRHAPIHLSIHTCLSPVSLPSILLAHSQRPPGRYLVPEFRTARIRTRGMWGCPRKAAEPCKGKGSLQSKVERKSTSFHE